MQCVQRLQDGTNRTLHTKYCPGQRPETRRPCSRLPCPAQWRTGAWSEVSWRGEEAPRPHGGVSRRIIGAGCEGQVFTEQPGLIGMEIRVQESAMFSLRFEGN